MATTNLVYDNIPLSLDQMIEHFRNSKPSERLISLWSFGHNMSYSGLECPIEIHYTKQLGPLKEILEREKGINKDEFHSFKAMRQPGLVDTPQFDQEKKRLQEYSIELVNEILDEMTLTGRLYGSVVTLAIQYYANLNVPLKQKAREIGKMLALVFSSDAYAYKIEDIPRWIGGTLFNDLRNFDPKKVDSCRQWLKEHRDPYTPISIQPFFREQIESTFKRIVDLVDFYHKTYDKSKHIDILRNRTALILDLHTLFTPEFQPTRVSSSHFHSEKFRERFKPKY